MTKTAIVLWVLFSLSSCGTGLQISKSKVMYFDNRFSAFVDNTAFKAKASRYGSPSLLGLFEIPHLSPDSVCIKFAPTQELVLQYWENGQKKEKSFKGQFKRKGYYEIFLDNYKKEIPPLFPIFFSSYNINRIRLAQMQNGDLIIDNRWNQSGNIFLLAAGSSGRRQSFFKIRLTATSL